MPGATLARVRTPDQRSCLHCQSPIPPESADARFCCAGCETVHGLLVDGSLTRFYDLARGQVLPVGETPRSHGDAWLEVALGEAERRPGALCSLEVDVQGLQCAACVWLISELFKRRPGGASITVNPAVGKARLTYQRGACDVRAFVSEVERFGYQLGPSRKGRAVPSRDLVVRLGVCVAATMNVMLFSISFYFGLSPQDADTFQLFSRLSLALATGVVLVGGWPFFKGAALGLRRGVAHLDLPIALGILLVFGVSVQQTTAGRGNHAYLDTLCTFVTLMLVGRWLQRRVLDRNRQFLLEDGGADGLLVRRREPSGVIAVVPAPRVSQGDHLLLAPGELAPVDGVLESEQGSFSLDWITGEPYARELAKGAEVPAGAFNAARTAAWVVARQPFAESILPSLLTANAQRGGAGAFFERLARGYVLAVLALASLGGLLWLHAGLTRAIDVAAAVLVVTCPCAIGLALPLAQELALAGLRRQGVLVRSGELLSRLLRVRTAVFDKTGTLTLSRRELLEPGVLSALSPEERDAAYTMVVRSTHPVSRCLAPALERLGARSPAEAVVHEVPGSGLSYQRGEHRYRLGLPSFAAPQVHGLHEERTTVFSRDGVVLSRLETREAARPGAVRSLRELSARGLSVWLASGDSKERVRAFAAQLEVPSTRVLAEQTPADKAAAVRRLSADGGVLFVGDGVNDSLAFDEALCTGTPALDRPVLPAKSDFILLGEDTSGLPALFAAAREHRRVTRQVLALAFAYNAVALTISLAGLMTPLAAAIAMPTSSISILLWVAHAVGGSRGSPSLPARDLQGAHA
ncbi:MAG: heavy metal translocating P-type ATPase metal-binding domain-containing protein [Deltaproteobacteria bacterium]|nr:heavy metal translocating P-type ATPase metal-binding domain-containing protein [Deltaproteobacteria bacterium]